MRLSAAERPHPPLDFPLYGLDSPAVGRRWVEFFEGQLGLPVWSVWLDHLIDDRLLVVRTAPQARWNDVMGRGAAAGMVEFAATGIRVLLDQPRPQLGAGEGVAYDEQLVSTSESVARQWKKWEAVAWPVDGEDHDARVRTFSNSWTGVLALGEDLYVGVTGINSTDPSVALTRVEGADYGFDFTSPFGIADLESRAAQYPDIGHILEAGRLRADETGAGRGAG